MFGHRVVEDFIAGFELERGPSFLRELGTVRSALRGRVWRGGFGIFHLHGRRRRWVSSWSAARSSSPPVLPPPLLFPRSLTWHSRSWVMSSASLSFLARARARDFESTHVCARSPIRLEVDRISMAIQSRVFESFFSKMGRIGGAGGGQTRTRPVQTRRRKGGAFQSIGWVRGGHVDGGDPPNRVGYGTNGRGTRTDTKWSDAVGAVGRSERRDAAWKRTTRTVAKASAIRWSKERGGRETQLLPKCVGPGRKRRTRKVDGGWDE